jgi:hypothetical protein
MPIVNITEILNPNNQKVKPIKEKQDIFIPTIVDKNIPNRNGFCFMLAGSGGSGKSSLMLNFFKSKHYYISFQYLKRFIFALFNLFNGVLINGLNLCHLSGSRSKRAFLRRYRVGLSR